MILNHIKAFGLPEVKAYGSNDEYNILIMELLGHSLEQLFQSQNQRFSLKTTCMLGIQMVERIEYIHSRKIIHRDIKPDNFAIGRYKNSHIVYILDFGLSKKYWSTTGYEQGRRDDLESIAYILIYFLKGSLPWQGLKVAKKEDRYKKICQKKKEISIEKLCSGLPSELQLFFNAIKRLDFTEVPDYDYLKETLKRIMEKNRYQMDFYFDWCREKPRIQKDNIIFTNDYGIEYNGKKEWLCRRDNNSNDENEDNYYKNNKEDNDYDNKDIKKVKDNEKYYPNIYSKPVFSSNNIPSFKNNKNITSIKIKLPKTSDNSNNGSKMFDTNYTSSRKHI